MPAYRPTIVLVHGAFANASRWSKIIPLLIADGFSVVAAHCPLSSLADNVAAVERVIGMQNAPVLLVGHSWGGAIITEAGNDTKVSGLVYIAAASPDSGESFNESWMGSPPAPGAPEIRPYGPAGYVALTAEGFRHHFGQDLACDETTALHATQGPFARGSNDEKISNAAWRDKPSWFGIKPSWFGIGQNDHMLLFELEKAAAQKLGAKTIVLSSSHLSMLSHAVADFIREAANQLGSTECAAAPTTMFTSMFRLEKGHK
jgi:pimeloyl-ACP methyl ester carboxylesterase